MTARKRPGRPPRGDKAATERIEIRVTRLERLTWERAAVEAGLTMSGWLREAAVKASAPTHRGMKSAGAPTHPPAAPKASPTMSELEPPTAPPCLAVSGDEKCRRFRVSAEIPKPSGSQRFGLSVPGTRARTRPCQLVTAGRTRSSFDALR